MRSSVIRPRCDPHHHWQLGETPLHHQIHCFSQGLLWRNGDHSPGGQVAHGQASACRLSLKCPVLQHLLERLEDLANVLVRGVDAALFYLGDEGLRDSRHGCQLSLGEFEPFSHLPDLVQIWQLRDQGKLVRGHLRAPEDLVITVAVINILIILKTSMGS